ncbi:UNVERIFIED_CONTAM: hypothetical protein QOZ25_18700 [Pseudomonas aeruginosa]|uniref:hypothetical protein n=1 Tax=Pseudomonas aeruginosa TaxID=287 RepID=UPI00345A8E3D
MNSAFRIPPFVSIQVGEHFTLENGEIVFGGHLMDESEIDFAVDSLLRELEEFRKAAKKRLQALKDHNEREFPRKQSS